MSPRTDYDGIPVRAPTVPVFFVKKDGTLTYAKSLREKRDLLAEYTSIRGKKPKLFAVWPGRYSSDIFEITSEKLAECQLTDSEYFSTWERK